MKSLTDYWRAKFVELQHQLNDEKKKSNSEKKELKDKILEQTIIIKELQEKISEFEKNVVNANTTIGNLEEEKRNLIKSNVSEIESIRKESVENVLSAENDKNSEESILISEFVRFLRKDVGNVDGLIRVLSEICIGRKAKKIIASLLEHMEWMVQLSDELSWFSEAIKKEEEKTNPDILFDDVITEFKEILSERNIQITKNSVKDIPEIPFFKDHLKMVFTELLRNSYDAMPKGGSIDVNISIINKNILIEIFDTGRGIPLHLIPKVSRPFFSTKKKNGFGFGLTRVRKILNIYNGRFDIISQEDKGTTVKILLVR
ncbi:MAG: hypothetical protein A2474_05900 [Elusimicrobia bacterium RIFOXYC2_FULL_34_12]|nr:MAG: hypothetical protein A2474_05900 [Elusimicrobia bacterium RIFOXYC2_FULL_34_12]OGS39148.1 MAG: hypothetical protein A2551_05650 [Elusimicrobia bacterium RIFOXYD2_FULL_34_30]HAM38896.1 hypothetical protein [Elusimicrobiota bacterium]